MIAAPLKLFSFPEGLICRTYFRDRMIAAPLKLRKHTGDPNDTAHFRDRMIAAPLKQLFALSFSAIFLLFPRSNDRGPIEALYCLPESSFSANFRDRMIAAPLKHLKVRLDFRDVENFRDRMIAAPLKRRVWVRSEPDAALFPRSNDRGPIEAI